MFNKQIIYFSHMACVNGQVYIELSFFLFGTDSCEVPTFVKSLFVEVS